MTYSNLLPGSGGQSAVEGHLLDGGHEFPAAPFLRDAQMALSGFDPQSASGEGAGENQRPGVLRDVDETAGAGEPVAEPAYIDVAQGVGLGHAEAGKVESAAIVEIELLVLGDDRRRIEGRAEIEPALRYAAEDAGFRRERHLLQQVFFSCHRGHGFRHADAQIDHASHGKLHGAAPCYDFSLVQRKGWNAVHRYPQLPRESRIVGGLVGLDVMLRRRQDNAIDQRPWDHDLSGRYGVGSRQPLDLRYDEALARLGRHGDGQIVRTSASRSMLMLPSGSAVVPRRIATSTGMAW